MAETNKPKKPNNKGTKTFVLWVAMILLVVAALKIMDSGNALKKEITFSEFKYHLENENIERVEIEDNIMVGEFKKPINLNGNEYETFKTILPFELTPDFIEEMENKSVKVQAKEKGTDWLGALLAMFPVLLILILFVFMMRQMQGGGRAFTFGKSNPDTLSEKHPKVTFEDVAGCDEAKVELLEIVEFLKDPKKFQKLGGKIPKGALLVGPPGTGKTLLAKAVSGEAGVPFMSISGSEFVEMFVGVGASRVRDLFEQGKSKAPCIIFIDEIDAVGRHRGAGLGGGHDEREQTLNQLLVEMDGFTFNEGVILLAATNRPDILDPALLRPGRFDRQIVIDRPDVKGREQILKVHSKKIKAADNIDYEIIAKGTPGLSGADLANIVNEAALIASRRDKEAVEMDDFEEAKDKVMMGTARKSLAISDEEKKTIAYHEAGHVLLTYYSEASDPIYKVTIIPRGRAMGLTHHLPDERHTYSKDYILAKLYVLMGGREAEKLVFGKDKVSTGAANDIQRASDLARKMVCNWGMSDKIGPIDVSVEQEEVFLGKELGHRKHYSEKTLQDIDSEVRKIIISAEKNATDILTAHRTELDIIAEKLIEKESLSADEIAGIITEINNVSENNVSAEETEAALQEKGEKG